MVVDIHFGQQLMTGLSSVPVGRSIAVRRTDILAVEATEGAIGLIEHVGAICRRKGWVLITHHPLTSESVEAVSAARGGMIVTMPGVQIDPEAIELANRQKIVLVKVISGPASEPDHG